MNRRLLTAAAACLLAFAAREAHGIEPQKTEAIVYRLQSFTPQEYAVVYSPPEAGDIHLIADTDNALDPRSTLVYYWPLTREYLESWEKLDAAVEGSLEILSGSRRLMSLQRTEVVLSYADASAEGASTLFAGEAARKARESFDSRRAEYEKGMDLYGRQTLDYRRALRDYMRSSARAPASEDPPVAPVEPQPPEGYVSDPLSAFVVHLPEGTYTARMVDAQGNVIEGSERRLVCFRPLAAGGTGYEIIPEERWTARLRSDARDDALFCMPGKEMYLIPSETQTYRQDQLARLRDPQSPESSPGTVVVPMRPRTGGRLVVASPGRLPRELTLTSWYVKQNPGAELGYSISEWSRETAGSDSPTFIAYRLSFSPEEAGSAWRISLEDSGRGGVVPQSERSLRVLNPGAGRLPWLFVAVPAIAGASVMIWRKRK